MTEPRRSLDTYGPQEMAIPEWRLVQKTGGDWAKSLGAKPGQFHNTITDEITDELSIVVVDVLMGRAKWGEEIMNVGPVCASMDARTNQSIYGTDCTQCEYRLDTPWSADVAERRRMCCLNYTLLGIDLDHDYLPVMIRAHGISALPARQLITQLKMNRALRGEYHKAIINIKSQEKDTPYGTAFALHPKVTDLITDESKAKELKGESDRLLGMPVSLPEGRPDDEGPEPLGFTAEGVPFYTEEEKNRLMAVPVEAPLKTETEPAPAPQMPAPKAPPATKTEPPRQEAKAGEPLDYDF